jgi:predicted RNA-binding Zn-ribbon protein involved in translation (DUF1610 family)
LKVADRFFPSSKRCNSCGHIHTSLGLEVREFKCESCGEHLDRDENAAKNILQFAKETWPTTAGQAGSNGRGEHVRPERASARSGNARRNVNQPSSEDVLACLYPRNPRALRPGRMSKAYTLINL